MKYRPVLLLAALLSVSACSVRPAVTLNPDGSGTAVVQVTLQKFLAEYLLELAQFTGSAKSSTTSLFNPTDVRAAFAKRPGVTVRDVKVPSPQELEISLAFSNVDDLARGEKELAQAGIIAFRNDGGTRTLRLHLDQSNFSKLSTMFPSEDGSTETILSVFGPQQGVKVTEAEYLETMEFTLGEQGPQALKASFIDVSVTVNGTLVSQKGGTAKGNTVTFRIPLLSVLLLNAPLDYEIVFK